MQRSTITVSTVSTPVVAQPQKLDSLKQQVDAFTENCTNERKTAEQALTAAKEQVTKSEQAQALQFKRISFVRDLMNAHA